MDQQLRSFPDSGKEGGDPPECGLGNPVVAITAHDRRPMAIGVRQTREEILPIVP